MVPHEFVCLFVCKILLFGVFLLIKIITILLKIDISFRHNVTAECTPLINRFVIIGQNFLKIAVKAKSLKNPYYTWGLSGFQ